jgi:hypothetical protein
MKRANAVDIPPPDTDETRKAKLLDQSIENIIAETGKGLLFGLSIALIFCRNRPNLGIGIAGAGLGLNSHA